MPVAGQRDPEDVKAALEPWLAGQVDAGSVEIVALEVPQSSGFSNETFLLDAQWEGQDEPARLVLRSQPQTHAIFPEIDLISQQYQTMKLLGEFSDVPVAKVLWAERGEEILGQPFFVMERLDGLVPGDAPPYTVEGFVVDMEPDQRALWHRNAVDVLTRVGKVDWRAAGFDYLDKAHHGPLGPAQRKGYLQHYLDWATYGKRHPVAHPAFTRLLDRWPDDDEFVELCWGDSRVGNQMFDGTEVIGVFDWEMVSLGNPESDLGWWLFVQRYSTEGNGVPLLEGMLDRDGTVALWEDFVGRPASHVEFYECLAGFQFTLVMVKLAEMLDIPDMAVDNPVAALTAQMLDL
jgi:aminoglycoside phosphotransferase (APT) family kinase protein